MGAHKREEGGHQERARRWDQAGHGSQHHLARGHGDPEQEAPAEAKCVSEDTRWVLENEAVGREARAMMIAASLGEDLGVGQEPGREGRPFGHIRTEAVEGGFEAH
jgi:hypothetical protein